MDLECPFSFFQCAIVGASKRNASMIFLLQGFLGFFMKPKRLGDLAQAKYVGQNENVPRGPGHEGRRSR